MINLNTDGWILFGSIVGIAILVFVYYLLPHPKSGNI